MAIATPELIAALERTVSKLQQGASYQWGHMGACNCGNLAQELTPFSQSSNSSICDAAPWGLERAAYRLLSKQRLSYRSYRIQNVGERIKLSGFRTP